MEHIKSNQMTKEQKERLENQTFDLIIIGGGSAGFSACIQADEFHLKTLMINDGLEWGGTCVNVGCVPSKVFVRAGESIHSANSSKFPSIETNGAVLDSSRLFQDAHNLVKELAEKKYLDVIQDIKNLTIVEGRAKLHGGLDSLGNSISILINEKFTVSGSKIILATGSRTNVPEICGIEKIKYLTNESIFNLENLPSSIIFLGAGYISLELAQAFRRLGSKVRILEYRDRVLRTQSSDVSEELETVLSQEGIELYPGMWVSSFETIPKDEGGKSIVRLHCIDSTGNTVTLEEEGEIFLGTGRIGNSDSLNLDPFGIETNQDKKIVVDEFLQTKYENIYAIGDVNDTPSYVYTAAYEGKLAVKNAFGKLNEVSKCDYSALPWVVFTDPQVAGVGLDEREAPEIGMDVDMSMVPVSSIPKSIASNETSGFIKLIKNRENDRLLGARVVAKEGGELIQLLSFFIKYKIPVSEIAESLYPYLTFSEGVKLSALAFHKDIGKLSCCAS